MNQFEPEDMPWVLDFCFTMAMTTFVAFWKTQGSEMDLAGYKQEVMSRFTRQGCSESQAERIVGLICESLETLLKSW